MPTTFLHLPVELRCVIKDWVDPADPRTHVCCYLAHPGCSALYDDTMAHEWFCRRLCWSCGLGQLPDEEWSLSDDYWRDIAIECVGRDGFCTLPYCGELLLEYNRARMREDADYIGLFEPIRISEDYREGGRAKFTIHPALYHVDFRAAGEHRYHYSPHPVENDAHFRWQRNGETKNGTPGDVRKRAYLGLHPLAARSFATASPIFNMTLFSAFYTGDATHLNFDRPVTVYDVLSAIHQGLDTHLSGHDVHSYLGYGSSHAQCVAHAKWRVEDAFANLQSTRQVLTL